ncbi:MAG: hypothetical protein LAT81_15465 [Oceanicaulis sp.]|nr:hypothetical protein [Oceanicaulis sp.]
MPGGHGKHSVEPSSEKNPESQGKQDGFNPEPLLFQYVPAGHFKHSLDPGLSDIVPIGHVEQFSTEKAAYLGWKVPIAHGEHMSLS